MIWNELKTALRFLWRNRLFTALNVLGLAIGIGACWIIFRILDHELSYDADLPHADRIYKVISVFNREGNTSRMGGVSAPLFQGIADELTGLEHVVPVFGQWVSRVEIPQEGTASLVHEEPDGTDATTPAYFAMLPYRWLAGNPATAMDAPESVVLTESRARLYFPGMTPETMLNRTITYYDFGLQPTVRRVTGVVGDFDTPTEFTTKEFFVLPRTVYESYRWTNTAGSDRLYVQVAEGSDIGAKLREINELDQRHWDAFVAERQREGRDHIPPRSRVYEFLPLREAHFSTHVDDYGVRKISKAVLYGLAGIGAFLLLLACINYVNMSVARIPQRAKEIGVRKTLGSGTWPLVSLFLCETLLTALLGTLLASVFGALAFRVLSGIIPEGVTPIGNVGMLAGFLLILTAVVTLLAGTYPAWLITRVRTADVFRHAAQTGRPARGFSLRHALIVFQFTIALVFITCTIVVGSQLRYTLKADMGFNKDAVVLLDIPWRYLSDPQYQDKQFTLIEEIRKLPGVAAASLGSAPLSMGYSASPFAHEPEGGDPIEITGYKKSIDTAYLDLYRVELLAGRNIRQRDTVMEYLINETAAKAFGFATPEEAVGRLIGQRGRPKLPIAGVVRDFHTQNFYTAITPVILSLERQGLTTLNIRLAEHDPAGWQQTLKAVGNRWKAFYPAESFAYRFYDESLEALYTQERQVSRLIQVATAITLTISCLGLFGLVTLTIFQRRKEIGIRKVLGATVAGILRMLSNEIVWLILVAMLIATPIAWWAMRRWLEDFVYRIDLQWWMFALAGATAMAVALLTVGWQAVRAALANPVDSLRDE